MAYVKQFLLGTVLAASGAVPSALPAAQEAEGRATTRWNPEARPPSFDVQVSGDSARLLYEALQIEVTPPRPPSIDLLGTKKGRGIVCEKWNFPAPPGGNVYFCTFYVSDRGDTSGERP